MIQVNLPPTTNAEDWHVTMALTVADQSPPGYDLTNYTVQVRLNDDKGCEVLSTTGTKSNDDDDVQSVISWTVPYTTMAGLSPGAYTAVVRIVSTLTTSATMVLQGKLAVKSGGFE
jgi:hypothetical protein